MKITSTEHQQYSISAHFNSHKEEFSHVKIKCVYFKASGKYYSGACEWFEQSLFEGCIYPSEYGRRLIELKILPGLSSGTWDGPFTVRVQGKYTELVLP